MRLIDIKGMELSQPRWLSGSPREELKTLFLAFWLKSF